VKAAIKIILPAAKLHQRAPAGYFLICEELEKGRQKFHVDATSAIHYSIYLVATSRYLDII
jgi:hypothetical protein